MDALATSSISLWIVPALPLFGAVVLLLFGKRIGEPRRGLDRHRR